MPAQFVALPDVVPGSSYTYGKSFAFVDLNLDGVGELLIPVTIARGFNEGIGEWDGVTPLLQGMLVLHYTPGIGLSSAIMTDQNGQPLVSGWAMDVDIADFTGDGMPDVLWSDTGPEVLIDGNYPLVRMQLIAASPDGPVVSYATEDYPNQSYASGYPEPGYGFWHSSGVGDINGDGALDFITINSQIGKPHFLAAFINDGAGNFTYTPSVIQPASMESQGIVDGELRDQLASVVDLADMNGDGRAEFIWGVQQSFPGSPPAVRENRVYWNNEGGYGAANYTALPLPAASAFSGHDYLRIVADRVRTADLNGDGLEDILFMYADYTNDNARWGQIWLQNPDHTFQELALWENNQLPQLVDIPQGYSLDAIDVNGDQMLDVVFSHQILNSLSDVAKCVWINTGDGDFQSLDALAPGLLPGVPSDHPTIGWWAIQDLDGDGQAELLVSTGFDETTITAYALENAPLQALAGQPLHGSIFADLITGSGGADQISAGLGHDTVNGGAGNDTINGDAGNDTFLYALSDGNGSMNGGADSDTLSITDGASDGILNATWNGAALTAVSGNGLTSIEIVTANLGGGVDWLVYAAGSAAVTANLTTGAASGFNSISNIERVVGGAANDALTGNGLDNRLDGGAGDDVLSGGGGVDTLIGGDGADMISGGLGNDSIQAGAGNDTINWAVGENRDTIDGGADVDTFNATGSASAELGNANWNGSSLTALMDNGLANIEAVNLDLGSGVDWLIYNATAAVVVNLATNSASGFASVTNIEKVIGASGNDTLTGDGLDNRLDGLAGNDTLDGGAGSDAVLGGDGADVIHASAGNDSLQGQAGNDTFHWISTDGRDTFNGGFHTDTVNLTGSAVADVADTNWNGSTITGLLNNALIDIEIVNLDLGEGGAAGDWLRYNTTSGISVDLGAGTATGYASIAGIENLIGGTGNDALTGDGGANKINGNNGDDIINGAGGNDNLIGGLGNDTFVYAAGAGNDTINDFDAWAVGGQDFIDVSAFGINAGNFAARVAIIDTGADTVIRIDDTYFITLKNVSGDGDNSISQADFIFGP